MASLVLLSTVVSAAAASAASPAPSAASYASITGNGSSWAGNAINQWQTDVKTAGVTVDYTPGGSSAGRRAFAQGLSDFAVSEIPYAGDTSDPQDTLQPTFAYSSLPVVGGGTSFMYNLSVNGSNLADLRLSQAALAGIFTGQITTWNDPAIAATNPGVNLPGQAITVVVRSDGSGATALVTQWLLRQFPSDYAALCRKTGCNPNAATSYFPYQGLANFTAQSGSNGVTGYTASTPYTIDYDQFSYAQGVGFPVAQVQNAAGYFTTPTSDAVAVALTQAKFDDDTASKNYLSQDVGDVYAYGDPRTYPLSAYSSMLVPAHTEGGFDTSRGATLGYFATHDVCEGQASLGQLGYSPLPMNLVLAGLDQVLKIPGVDAATQSRIAQIRSAVASGDGNPCDNPTYQPGADPAYNALIDTAPFPDGCDSACQAPWTTGGGADPLVSVSPSAETSPAYGDAAGGGATAADPAIWVDRAHPARSRVITTLRDAGLAVYDLDGHLVQSIAAPAAPGAGDETGSLIDVDVVRGVMMNGRRVALAIASDGGRDQIRTFLIDPADGRLTDLTSPRIPFAFSADQSQVDQQQAIDGLAAYRAADGAVYVVGSRRHTSEIGMFRLVFTATGVTYRRVDTLSFPDTFDLPGGDTWSPCEAPGEAPQLGGLVVGPAGRQLFAAQEDVGIWRLTLETGSFLGAPHSIERTREFGVPAAYDDAAEKCMVTGPDPGLGGRLAADVEGLSIYNTGGGQGTLIASSQGDSTFYTYDRQTFAATAHFRVASRPGLDGAQHTDGIDSVSSPLPGFSHGLLVVQDARNTPDRLDGDDALRPDSNIKLVDAQVLSPR